MDGLIDLPGSAELSEAIGRESHKHVLLLVTDLYAHFGGGQTAYKAIIANSPNTIFYYFVREEHLGTDRPTNAIPIRREA